MSVVVDYLADTQLDRPERDSMGRSDTSRNATEPSTDQALASSESACKVLTSSVRDRTTLVAELAGQKLDIRRRWRAPAEQQLNSQAQLDIDRDADDTYGSGRIVGPLLSGSPGALLRRGPLRTRRAAFTAPGSSKPTGSRTSRSTGHTDYSGEAPLSTVCVHEVKCDGISWHTKSPLGGDRFLADRFAGHREPLLPLGETAWLMIGKQQ